MTRRLPFVLAVLSAEAPALSQGADPEPPEIPGPQIPAGQPEPAGDSASLARQLANPIASLISVPFQQNVDFGLGPTGDGVRTTLNIQPVVPISIGPDANLVVRTILPVIYQNSDVTGEEEFGLGDTVQSFFLSPTRPTRSGIVWGAGPALLLPTGMDRALGFQKWGIGPTFVALKQDHGWTFGALGNHIWSFAGNDNRADVSQTFLQPFVNYTWPSTVGVALSAETLYNWTTEQWTVPINLGVSKIVRLGSQRASIQAGVRYYAEKPDDGPDWGIRLSFTLLFPRR